MDNASKALILAGGFLIGVLVISISVYILNTYRQFYSENMMTLNSYQVSAFNSYFTKYKDTISGVDAFNILSRVSEINSDFETDFLEDSISTAGTVTLANYKEFFYFAERLLNTYHYSYSYDSRGVINSITIDP